jgi:non-canonical (house-cleaning) NTP pyrophosphatase
MNLGSRIGKVSALNKTSYFVSVIAVLAISGLFFSSALLQVNAATTTAKIDLKPDKGTVNRTVTISNKGGFLASATITIEFGSKVVATTTSNSSGGFTTTFKVPQAVVGTHKVTATDGTNTVTKTFTVVTNIAIKPKMGKPGATLNINGTGFAASSTVKITFNSKLIDTVKSNSTGGFSASFTVPNDPAGAYPIVGTDASRNTANATYTIS